MMFFMYRCKCLCASVFVCFHLTELTFQIDADTLVRDVKKRRVIFQASNSPNLIVKNARVKTGELTDVVNALAYMKVLHNKNRKKKAKIKCRIMNFFV